MDKTTRIQNGYVYGNQTAIQTFHGSKTARARIETFNVAAERRIELAHINEIFAVMVGNKEMTGITIAGQEPLENAAGSHHQYAIVTDAPIADVKDAHKKYADNKNTWSYH